MVGLRRLPPRSIRSKVCATRAPTCESLTHFPTGFCPIGSMRQTRGLEIVLDPHALREEARRRNLQKKRKAVPRGYRFVDRARICVRGGDGGKGSVSQHFLGQKCTRDGLHKRHPDGGNGGRGGSVVLVADPWKQTLRFDRPHIHAADGKNGSSNFREGASAPNKIVKVPCGVVVRRVLDLDEEWIEEERCIRKLSASDISEENLVTEYTSAAGLPSVQLLQRKPAFKEDEDSFNYEEGEDGFHQIVAGEEEYNGGFDKVENVLFFSGDENDDDPSEVDFEDRQRVVLADLDKPGSWVVVALGGRGGSGSGIFSSKRYKSSAKSDIAARAQPTLGEVCHLDLEMKMIADLGLVGFPNSGKSSLLAAMSRAAPRIAPYPFTTLHPLVGVIEYRDGFRVKAADVPGLVEGAAQGRGRGSEFLRHLERTKALLYIVDAAGVDGRDPIDDFRILVDEVMNYGEGDMMGRPALLAANKVDLLTSARAESLTGQLREVAEEAGIRLNGSRVHRISAGVSGEGLGSLSKEIRRVVEEKA